jgi:hypothetical protein
LAALLLITGSLASFSTAQDERPQITPGERKAARKKDAGPRAVGVVQLGANGKASLVPIAILVNGKFWDASAYKADPVPMALDSGTVYEGERSGSSLGLFTVGSALHSNNAAAAIPWLGTGMWRANGTEPTEKVAKAEAAPVGIADVDAPPRLSRETSTATASAPPAASSKPASSSTAPPPASSKPSSSSGDEPPRLKKESSAPEPDATKSAPSATSESSKANDPKPGDTKAAGNKPKEHANVPASDSGASETNRPKLRRGKPEESFADEDIPGYSPPGAKPSSTANSGKVVEAAAANKDVQLIPAISDASGPIPKSFAFDWIPGEEGDRRKQMADLAKDQIRAYVTARTKANAPATAKRGVPPKRLQAPKPPDPILENMQMVAYDLWNSNQPVLILSAQAHMPPPAAGSALPPTEDLQYSIVLVAYPDIYHNLHKLFIAITDKYHLDMTPRLDLIDAVDADGDGRGELLFRETSDLGTGWVLYRATADKLWKVFDSLNPE